MLQKLITISPSQINDGYCDCPLDGIDEPNTSACSGSIDGGWAGVSSKYKPTDEQAAQFFELSDSLRNLSKQQQVRVKAASKMLHALGAPTLEDLKSVIRMNLIRNNKVTTEDVNLALKTLGPDVATIKGKTTRRKPQPVVDNIIELPDELLNVHREVELSVR